MLLHDALDHYAQIQPELDFATLNDQVLSYRQARSESNRLANALGNLGLKPGDRVAFLAKNSIEMMLMLFAASRSGVVVVPLNYRLAPPEWAYILNDSESRALICAAEFCPGIDEIRMQLQTTEHFFCLETLPAEQSADTWQPYSDWIATAGCNTPVHKATASDTCYQMYTSGTTGQPKGVLISQHNLQSNIQQWICSMQIRYPVASRTLVLLPLYHAAAVMQSLVAVQNGHSLVIHPEVDPARIIDSLSQQSICWTAMVPAVIQICLQQIPTDKTPDFSTLQAIIYGASPISSSVLEQAMATFGCDFAQGFGQTEATALLTAMNADDHRQALLGRPELLRSAGRAMIGTELRIIDHEGQSLPAGEVGELIARGPQVMQGYWHLPDASAKTLIDGWLYTGDAASIDAEGYVYIQDRIKDMIVSGGENIYPAQVENVLHSHPDILDAAVIGVPDADFGEAVMAMVVLRPGEDISEEQLQAHCRSQLAGYKVPRALELVDQIQRSPSGKPDYPWAKGLWAEKRDG